MTAVDIIALLVLLEGEYLWFVHCLAQIEEVGREVIAGNIETNLIGEGL